MSDVAVSSPVTEAYLDELATATGRPIGDHRKPPGQENIYPYGVLRVDTPRTEGTLVDPNEDGLHRLQVSCIGLTRDSAEHLRDLARAVLHDRSVVIDGHAVVWTESAGSTFFRDEDVKPPVFEAVVVVNVLVTPIPGS